MEQAKVVRVVQRLDTDRQVLLLPILAGLEIIQGIALAPGLRTDGIVLAEDRVTVAFLVVHIVLTVIYEVLVFRSGDKEVARHSVNGRSDILFQAMVPGIPLGGSQQSHFFQSVMDEFRATGIGRHGRVREVALRTGQLRADGTLTQPEQVLLPFRCRRAALLPVAVNLPVTHTGGVSARRLLEVETQVLSRVVHR